MLLAVFALGIALMLSIANVYFRDTAQFVGIFMQIWFYATPIVYPVSLITKQQDAWVAEGNDFPLVTLYKLNPLEHFTTVFRNLFYDNRWPSLRGLRRLRGRRRDQPRARACGSSPSSRARSRRNCDGRRSRYRNCPSGSGSTGSATSRSRPR